MSSSPQFLKPPCSVSLTRPTTSHSTRRSSSWRKTLPTFTLTEFSTPLNISSSSSRAELIPLFSVNFTILNIHACFPFSYMCGWYTYMGGGRVARRCGMSFVRDSGRERVEWKYKKTASKGECVWMWKFPNVLLVRLTPPARLNIFAIQEMCVRKRERVSESGERERVFNPENFRMGFPCPSENGI